MRSNEAFYTVYILTNIHKSVLYIGITNDLERRITEHYNDRITKKTFAGKYNCHFIVHHEAYKYVNDAIAREKELKGWLRRKKDKLIHLHNPEWKFLNELLLGKWPPDESGTNLLCP